MTRKSYVQINGKLVDKDELQNYEMSVDSGALWGDQHYAGMKAPDGTDISTRSKHREYMKRTGLVTFDDYQATFAKEQERRDAYHSGQRGTVSRADIERTIAKLTGQY